MAGYQRQATANIQPDLVIDATDLNSEFNAVANAFNTSTGHKHDGSPGEGAKISLTASVSGILPLANGGTGAANASLARTNLGLGSSSTVDTGTSGNKVPLLDGTNTWSNLQTFSLGANFNANLTLGSDVSISFAGTGAATTRANLGLGSLATLSSINNSNWSGTALSLANGGTGATSASSARTNLGLGTLATVSPTGTASASTYLRGDNSWATLPSSGVLSVGLTAPTGFTVSNSPVTSTGNLALTYASGYQGYTTADKSKLNGIEAGAQVNTVTSVAGRGGAVTIVKGDVGLGNVDNTSDANKPISSAQAAAINAKVTKANDTGLGGFTAASKGLSTSGTINIAPTDGNIQHCAKTAAVTFNAPTAAGVYTIIIEVHNTNSTGAVTLSGFTKVDGDAFTTTSGHKFQVYIAKTNSAVTATVKELQ